MNDNQPNPKSDWSSDSVLEPQVLEQASEPRCPFCDESLQEDFFYCTQCGKVQNQEEEPKKEPLKEPLVKKRIPSLVKPLKKPKKNVAAFAFSIVFFACSALAFIVGFVLMLRGYAPSLSLFGSDASPAIFTAGIMISCFLISLLFSLLGMFLFLFRK